MTFEHAVPESVGLDSQHILDFLDELEKKHVPMHSFLLFSGESVLADGYYAPYTRDSLHRMFSISKSFTAIAIGILAGDGLLALSDPVIRYFPDKLPEHVHPWIAEMTIENLLMMRTCHASTTYKNGSSDWVGSFFTTPPTHRAGTIFHYDTSAAHVLAALVERLSGMPLLDFLKERLRPLALSQESYMLTDPEGVSMGGTGLVATTADLLKFGYLLLKNGNIDGKQLVPAEFLARATSCLTETAVTAPLPSEGCGYCYMIWKNERGGYVCYGMGGQLLMVFPEKQTIFVTTADTQGIAGGNQLIYDAFYRHLYDNIKAAPAACSGSFGCHDNAAQQTLIHRLASLAIAPLSPYADGISWVQDTARLRRFSGSSYRIVDTSCNRSVPKRDVVSGFTYFSFIFTESGKGLIQFTLDQQDYTLSFGFGKMERGMFPVYDLAYTASGAWLDEHTLYVRFHIIDRYVGSVHMQFYFGENDITIFMKKVEESCFAEFNGHFYGIKEKK
jgi:CubicO group peptidase (beta-lactamase class C family)